MDLSVDTYYQILQPKKTPNAEGFKAVGKDQLFNRFMKDLSIQEAEALKVLSNARFYTLEPISYKFNHLSY